MPVGNYGGKSRGGGDSRLGKHQANDGIKAQCQVCTSCRISAEGRILLGNERPKAYHLRAERPDKAKVCNQMIKSLERASHHHAHPGLESELPEFMKAFQPVLKRHFLWVEHGVMRRSGSLMPQEITVCPRLPQSRIKYCGKFSK